MENSGRTSDLFMVILGATGALLLILTPGQVVPFGFYPFYKGPRIFPILSLSLMVLASLPATWRLIRGGSREAGWRVDGHGSPIKAATMLAASVAFLIGIVLAGLEIATFLFLSGCLYWLGHRSPTRFLGVSLIYTAVVVVIFKYVLAIYFPSPLLWALLE
jgi:hypothetical protein